MLKIQQKVQILNTNKGCSIKEIERYCFRNEKLGNRYWLAEQDRKCGVGAKRHKILKHLSRECVPDLNYDHSMRKIVNKDKPRIERQNE